MEAACALFSGRQSILLRSSKQQAFQSQFRTRIGRSVKVSCQKNAEVWKWGRTAKEAVAYGVLLTAVPIAPLLPRFEWSAAVYFTSLSLWTIYVGSHRSLGQRNAQKVSLKQGFAAPVLCSVTLFALYCLIRYFPDLDLRIFVSAYLCTAGAFGVATNLASPLKLLFPAMENASIRFELPTWFITDEGKAVCLTVSLADAAAFFVGAAVALASRQPGAPSTFNNLMAVCIVTELLQLLSLGSFTTAAVMLCGLLLYDVFWVFGSSSVFGDNVMVTVATAQALDGPMKIVFPSWKANAASAESILGLGDIAAPGLLIALMLRFDEARTGRKSSDKTYFSNSVAAYIAGLAATVVVNNFSGAAQPALLYLVPSILGSVLITAVVRSETPMLLSFKDETFQPLNEDGM